MKTTLNQTKPSILVVDDTTANLALLSAILGDDYRVIVEKSGEKGLEIARTGPRPDLILLDIVMPGLDGLEVCRQLKADPALCGIPVIFISAITDSSQIVGAFAQGGVDYVFKPFQEKEVLARVETHLQIVALRIELSEHNERLEGLVDARTSELVTANVKLEEMNLLKNEFLQMIAHEMRTPANGLLGVGQIILDMIDEEELSELFIASSQRLQRLIDDAMLLGELEKFPKDRLGHVPVAFLLEKLNAAISAEVPLHVVANVDHELCRRALRTFCVMADIFCQQDPKFSVIFDDDTCKLVAELDSLELSGGDTEAFFQLSSTARPRSKAEELSLAPVVAHAILSTFGGALRLVKDPVRDRMGFLEAVFPTATVRQDLSTVLQPTVA